jgi:hypothetical protein
MEKTWFVNKFKEDLGQMVLYHSGKSYKMIYDYARYTITDTRS